MQPPNEDRTSIPVRQPDATARRSASTSQSNVQRNQGLSSDSNTTQMNIRSASSALIDTLSRLEQIRRTLEDIEASGLNVRRPSDQLREDNSRSNPDSNIGPPHSAIVLSDENYAAPFDTDILRNRLDELGADLPEYMRATANIIWNMRHEVNRETRHTTSSPIGSNGTSPQTASSSFSPRMPDIAPERYARPRRDSNSNGDERTEYGGQQSIPSSNHATRRLATRDDGSASTLLGRRVASRAAAASARPDGNAPPDQRARLYPSQLRPGSYALFGDLSQNSSPSPVIPPPPPEMVTARFIPIGQLEDSDGSETEVDDLAIRPVIVRRDGGRPRSVRQSRTDTAGLRLPVPPPVSLPTGTQSEGTSSSGDSQRPSEEDYHNTVASRLQNVYGRLDRLTGAITLAPRDASPLDEADSDGPLFLRHFNGSNGERFAYGEVVENVQGRSYRIRRRMNADGDEQVHQIITDGWWDGNNDLEAAFATSSSAEARTAPRREETSWARFLGRRAEAGAAGNTNVSQLDRIRRRHAHILPSNSQRSETDLPPLNADLPPQNTQSRARRGWAHLNANGEEISADEEEEFERARLDPRLRNGQSAWRNTMSASTARARLEYLAPTTRSVFSHTTDEDENDARVRLRLPPGQSVRSATFTVFSDVMLKENEPETEREYFGTSEPYYINPLPIPSEHPISSNSGATVAGPTDLRDMERAAR